MPEACILSACAWGKYAAAYTGAAPRFIIAHTIDMVDAAESAEHFELREAGDEMQLATSLKQAGGWKEECQHVRGTCSLRRRTQRALHTVGHRSNNVVFGKRFHQSLIEGRSPQSI